MAHEIICIPGDGIGPEIMKATKLVLAAAKVEINWIPSLAGVAALNAGFDVVLPKSTLTNIRQTRVALKGPTRTPENSDYRSANVQIRTELDLYANIRPLKTFRGVANRYSDLNLDMVIFRETTEDVYGGQEIILPGYGCMLISINTFAGSRRIAVAAFEYARKHGRKKVTIIHKANINKHFNGLAFKDICYQVSEEYPEIECNDIIIDNSCNQMVINPEQFDVILAQNMNGDILSDLAAGVVSKLGLACGANIGDRYAVFEPVHGTADALAGKNIANPTAMILSAAMMLDHIGEPIAAAAIRAAVEEVLARGVYVTGDIKEVDPVGTTEMAEAIATCIQTGHHPA